MKSLTARLTAILVLVIAAAVLASVLPGRAHSQESNQQAEQSEEANEDESNNTYEYIAQPGDSYSLIARKAVQTYGLIHEVSLSQAQIIAAETFLTKEAGEPLLGVGQEVSVTEDKVKAAMDRAQGLSETVLSLWQTYADQADFNTDNVGEARE